MFGGALVSFVKRLFGRALKSDESSDNCRESAAAAAAAGGDYNGNVPSPSVGVRAAVVTTPASVRSGRRANKLDRHFTHAATDNVEAVCSCQNCYSCCDDSPHPVNLPHVNTTVTAITTITHIFSY